MRATDCRAPLIELVGLAGAGKTSSLRTLGQRDPAILPNIHISTLSYVRDVPSLLPIFAGMHRPWHSLLRKEMKRVLHLTTLQRRVEEIRCAEHRPIVLDEGPVYMLARLLFLGGDRLRGRTFEQWWRTAIADWAQALDLIVWLQADTPTLIERIRTRRDRPPISDLSDRALNEFLCGYSTCYRRVVDELIAKKGPRLLTIDTGQRSINVVADQILATVSAKAA
jgi:predicted ATPase